MFIHMIVPLKEGWHLGMVTNNLRALSDYFRSFVDEYNNIFMMKTEIPLYIIYI